MSTNQIIGRDAELRALDERLLEGSNDATRCLALSGEPGIGKTVLLEEACRRAQLRGFRTARGGATEFERDVPFALVSDALEALVVDRDLSASERLGSDELTHLAAVFPALPEQGSPRPEPRLTTERYLLHNAVRSLLEELASERPLLLALDDLHWADDASLELVAHLIRRPADARVPLLVAYRPHRAPGRLISALGAAAREGSVFELALDPLSERDGEALLGDDIEPSRRRRLYAESGGNPLYLSELARAANGDDTPPAGPLPQVISATISNEVEQLSRHALVLLHSAAVLGDPFDFELTSTIADLSGSEPFDALDELLASALVDPGDDPTSFRFRHPIVRRALYESLPAGQRLGIHRRAVDALAARGAPLSARAHHVERSAGQGDEVAIGLLESAGREDAGRSPAAAARWFRAALDLLPRQDRDRRLSLLVPMASELAAAGRADESAAALLEALDLLPSDRMLFRARVIGVAAGAERMAGNPGAARTMLAQALAELPDEPSAARAALSVELGLDAWLAGDWSEITARARSALGDARATGDRALEADAAALLALAEYHRAREPECSLALARAAAVIDSLSPGELSGAIRALLFVGYAYIGMERAPEASATLRHGIAVSRESGQEFWFVTLLGTLVIAELWQGELSSAAEHAEEAVDAATLLDNDQLLMWVLAARCWVRTLRGEIEAAVHSGELACEALSRSPASGLGWFARCSLGAALVEAGDYARGRDTILEGGGDESLAAIEPSFRGHWYEVLCAAELGLTDIQQAERWLSRADGLVSAFPLLGRVGELRRGRAMVSLARGEAEGAATEASKAVEGFREAAQPIEAARAAILMGRALAASGRRDDAVAILRDARRELDRHEAAGYRGQAERELAALKVATGDNPLEALTPREFEVADLVAAGLSNREVAAELVITHRTVERHLSKIYAKLGINSRSALAAAVERRRG